MNANKTLRDPMPDAAASIDEIVAFWDAHSTADYADEMEDVSFAFDIQEETFTVALVPSLVGLLAHKAKANGVSTETLVNLWLAERLQLAA